MTLSQAIEHIMKLSSDSPLLFPHHHHLLLYLYTKLDQLVAYEELTEYLANDPKKKLALAEQLSHVFLYYGLYGSDALEDWMQTPGWQQELFSQVRQHWDFPHFFLQKDIHLSIDTHFHLFALPHLPELYRHLFFQVGATVYHRMATPHYIEDLLTDKSLSQIDTKLKKKDVHWTQRKAFYDLASQPNRFFTNFAKPFFAYTNWVQSFEPEESFSPITGETFLSCCKKGFYDLAPFELPPPDQTIELHKAQTKFQEIEILYHHLIELFHNDPSFKTTDVQIFAPDMTKYLPAIEYLFGQKDSPFGYCIEGVEQTPSIIRTFFHLTEKRFEPSEILELLTSPLTKFESEEMAPLFFLLDHFHVYWGYDEEMRRDILGTDDVFKEGTFKHAFETLLLSLPYLDSPLEISQAEEFGNFVTCVETIARDLKSLKYGVHTIEEWILLLTDVTTKTFVNCEEVQQFLKEIAKLSPLTHLTTTPIPFPPLLKIIHEITANKEQTIAKTDKPYFHFSNIELGKLASCRATFLLSMDEEAFPRKEQTRHLNQIKTNPKSEPHPSITEKDKAFLLDVLAYTKDRVICSYTSISDADGKELLPSLALEEFHLPVRLHEEAPLPPQTIETLHKSSPPPLFSLETLDIRHLFRLAAHPIRFYLQMRCGIYLKTDEIDTGEFLLSYQTRAQIRQKAYLETPEMLHKYLTTHSLLPSSLFSIAAKQEVADHINEANERLNFFGLEKTDFVTLHLDPAIKEPILRNSQELLFPPIDVEGVLLYGEMGLVTKKGLFSFEECSPGSIWKLWPKILVLMNLKQDLMNKFPPILLFAKDGQRKEISLKDPAASLKRFVKYAQLALEKPSPLMPSVVKEYGKKEVLHLTGGLFKDPYLEMTTPDLSLDWTCYIEEAREYF